MTKMSHQRRLTINITLAMAHCRCSVVSVQVSPSPIPVEVLGAPDQTYTASTTYATELRVRHLTFWPDLCTLCAAWRLGLARDVCLQFSSQLSAMQKEAVSLKQISHFNILVTTTY